jgi:hypothetical protein
LRLFVRTQIIFIIVTVVFVVVIFHCLSLFFVCKYTKIFFRTTSALSFAPLSRAT